MKSETSISDLLQDLFPQFEPDLKKVLADHGEIRDFEAGEMLMQTGQNMRSTIVIVDGLVKGLMIPITMMDTLMKDYKTWYYFVLEAYRSRLEELLTVIDNIALEVWTNGSNFTLLNNTRISIPGSFWSPTVKLLMI